MSLQALFFYFLYLFFFTCVCVLKEGKWEVEGALRRATEYLLGWLTTKYNCLVLTSDDPFVKVKVNKLYLFPAPPFL